jgi:multidrug resistance efflux pump
MKAEVLDSPSSPPAGEVNYTVPVASPSPPARHWRSIALSFSLGVLVLSASFVIAAISLHSHASPSSTPATTAANSTADGKRWYSEGFTDIEGGITPLYPLQMGRVKGVKAKENEFVKAGAELFHLDDRVQRLDVQAAEKDLEGAQKELAIAEAGVGEADKQIEAQKTSIALARINVELARIIRDKQKRFEEKGIAGDKESLQAAEKAVEKAELGVQAEQKKLAIMEDVKHKAEGYAAAAKVKVEGKQLQLDKARHAVDECVVRAPVDGTPLRILVTVGETLGANPHQPAIQFAADRPLLVRAEVGQEFVDHVKLEQQVLIEDSVTEKEIARGKVARIARWFAPRRTINADILSTSNDNRTVECIIHIDSPSPALRLGQRVRVHPPD